MIILPFSLFTLFIFTNFSYLCIPVELACSERFELLPNCLYVRSSVKRLRASDIDACKTQALLSFLFCI